ncbi:predicted protein [Chaetoceros tenuissimus]|nr:predicted protein [Chaetoceros tenuissimus]
MTVEGNQLDEQKEKLPLQIPYSPMETVNGVENQTEIEQKEQATLQVTQTSSVSTLGEANQPGEQNKQVAMQFPPNQVGAEATVNIPQNQVGTEVTANIPHNKVAAEVTTNIPQVEIKSIDGGNNQSSEKNEKNQVGVQVPKGQSEAMETTFVQQKEEVALETAKVDNDMNKVNDDEQKHSQSPQFPEQQLYRVVNYVEIQEPAEEEQKDEQGLVIQWKKTRKSSIDEKRNTTRKDEKNQTSNISGTKVNFQLEAIDKKEIDDMASPDLLRIEQELPASSELSSVDDTLILSWLKENEIEEEAEKRMKFESRKECLLHYIKKKNFLPQVGTTKSSPAGMMQKRLEDAMAESNVSNISQDDISKLSLNVGGSQEGRNGISNGAAPSVSQNTMTGNQKPRRIEVVRRQVNVVERKTNAITPVESANRPRLNVNDSSSHKQVNRAAAISPTESANRPRLNVNEVRSKSVNESANRPRLNVNEVRSKRSTITNSSSISNQRSNHMRPPQVVPKAKKATMNWTTDDASITPKNDSVARTPQQNRKVEVTRKYTPQNDGTMDQAPSQASPSTTVVNSAARAQQRRVEVPRTVQNNNQVQSPMRTSSPSPSSATKTTKQSNAGWGSTDTTRTLKQEVPTVDDGNQKLVPNAVKKRTPNSIHSRQENAVKPKKDKVQFPAYPKKELLQNAVKRKIAASGMMGRNNKVEFPAYPKDVATTSTKTNEPKAQTAPMSNQSMKQAVTTQAKEQNPYLRTPEEEEELKRLRENVVWKWSTTPNLDTKVRR